MILKREALSALQLDLLVTTLNAGGLKRAKGGYIAAPGAKPFSVRTVMALHRYGLISLSKGTALVAVTTTGSQLLLIGEVEIPEEQAG